MTKITIAVITLLAASSCYGQNKTPPDSISTSELDEIIIESRKFMNNTSPSISKIPLKNIENPQVYTSISSVILEKQLAYSLEDAMKNAAGVSKIWDATGRIDGGSIFASRGFSNTVSSRNGVLNSISTNADLSNLERLEIIKGPSATLFGSLVTSYGGFINRVTKQPKDYFFGQADLLYGEDNLYRAALDINIPLDQHGLWALRINASHQNQDSWQTSGYSKSTTFAPALQYISQNSRLKINFDGEFVNTKGSSMGGNNMFFMDPTELNTTLQGALQAQGLPDAMIKQIISAAPKTYKEAYGSDNIKDFKLDYNQSYSTDDFAVVSKTRSLFINGEYTISQHWKSQSAATYNYGESTGDMMFQYLVPNYLPSFIMGFGQGIINFGTSGHDYVSRSTWRVGGDQKSAQLQQNFNADYTFGNVRNRSVIGVDFTYLKSRVAYDAFVGNLLGVPVPLHFDLVPTRGAAEDFKNLTPKSIQKAYEENPPYTLNQYEDKHIYSAYINDVMNIGEHIILSAGARLDKFHSGGDGGYDQTHISPKLGVIIMPIKNQLSFFANYQNGFKNVNGTSKTGKSFTPEQANQWETGIKFSLLNDRIGGNISYYNIKVKDIVRPDPTSTLFSIQNGEQESKGVEFELFANPATGWNLMLGYAHNDSKFIMPDATNDQLRPLGSGPEDSFNFWSNYTFTQYFLKGFGVGFQANYTGDVYATNSSPESFIIAPKHTVLGTSFYYTKPTYRIALKINNLTDQKYWMGWTNLIPQRPRQVIGSITYKF